MSGTAAGVDRRRCPRQRGRAGLDRTGPGPALVDRRDTKSGGQVGGRDRGPRPTRSQEGPGAVSPSTCGDQPRMLPPGAADVDARLADMDTEGIDVQVLFGGLVLGVTGYDDPGLALDVCRAYNDWLAAKEVCGRSPDRLEGASPSCRSRTVDRAIERGPAGLRGARRGRRDHPAGARGSANLDDPCPAARSSRRAPTRRSTWPSPSTPAPGMHLPLPGAGRFSNYAQVHALSRSRSTRWWRSPPSTLGGVLDRYQRLRVAFLESGVGWVPYFVHRLHEHHEKLPGLLGDGGERSPGHRRAGPVLLLVRGRGVVARRPTSRALRRHVPGVRQRLPPLGQRLSRHRRRGPPPTFLAEHDDQDPCPPTPPPSTRPVTGSGRAGQAQRMFPGARRPPVCGAAASYWWWPGRPGWRKRW